MPSAESAEERQAPEQAQEEEGAAGAGARDMPLPPLMGAAGGAAAPRYGFNRSYRGVFRHLREEVAEVLRMPDPEATPEAMRTLVRACVRACLPAWLPAWLHGFVYTIHRRLVLDPFSHSPH